MITPTFGCINDEKEKGNSIIPNCNVELFTQGQSNVTKETTKITLYMDNEKLFDVTYVWKDEPLPYKYAFHISKGSHKFTIFDDTLKQTFSKTMQIDKDISNVYITIYYDQEKITISNTSNCFIRLFTQGGSNFGNGTTKVKVFVNNSKLLDIDYIWDDGHRPYKYAFNLSRVSYKFTVFDYTINVVSETTLLFDNDVIYVYIGVMYESKNIYISKDYKERYIM
ncbi:MAG: hypothetical protein QF682_09900 [Candidatus Thermoplasmatota archaeon]|nr:hypothetical protein [Candidatus Thermoplasmatota archaeon]